MKRILTLIIASASLLLADGNTTTIEVTTPEVAVQKVEVKAVETAPIVVTPEVKVIKTPVVVVPKVKVPAVATPIVLKKPCKCIKKRMHRRDIMKAMKSKNSKRFNKYKKRKHNSSLLVKRGLTPLLKVVMMSAKDPLLGLDGEQLSIFRTIKKDIMPRSKSLKKDIRAKKRAIQLAITAGTTVEAIKVDMKDLALLRADATLLRIECINRTKAVLSKDQLIYLLGKSIRKNRMQKHKCNAKRCHKKR